MCIDWATHSLSQLACPHWESVSKSMILVLFEILFIWSTKKLPPDNFLATNFSLGLGDFFDRIFKKDNDRKNEFSIEIGPHSDIETLPALSDVYVTMLPGGDYKETADKALELVKKGFNPVPHFPARSMNNEQELKDYVNKCKDGGVKQAFNIGGGRDPVGKFDSSIQLLETGYFEKMKIGIAGHPEGSPDISDTDLEKAMIDKSLMLIIL